MGRVPNENRGRNQKPVPVILYFMDCKVTNFPRISVHLSALLNVKIQLT